MGVKIQESIKVPRRRVQQVTDGGTVSPKSVSREYPKQGLVELISTMDGGGASDNTVMEQNKGKIGNMIKLIKIETKIGDRDDGGEIYDIPLTGKGDYKWVCGSYHGPCIIYL